MILREPNTDDIEFVEKLLFQFKGMRVVDIRRSNKGKVLEITLYDANSPVSSDDCDRVSEVLSNSEDFYAHFGDQISFQVASPGIERKLTSLRELTLFVGRDVLVHFQERGKPKEVVGILLKTVPGKVSFSSEGTLYEVPVEDVNAVRLYYDFDQDEQ